MDRLGEALRAIPLSIVILDATGIVRWTNTTDAAKRTDSPTWIAGGARVGESYLDLLGNDASAMDTDTVVVLSGIRKIMRGDANFFQSEFACEYQRRRCWYRLEARRLDDAMGAVITCQDISQQKRTEDELHLYRERIEQDTRLRIEKLERRNTVLRHNYVEQLENECALRQAASVFVNSSEAVVITDDQRRIIKVNEAFSQISGYRVDEVFGQNVGMLHVGNRCGLSLDKLSKSLDAHGHWQGEFHGRRKNGDSYPAWGTIDAVHDEDGHLVNYICLFSDITTIKDSQRNLHFLAHHDPLTGLANRLLFWARLEQSIQHARRHQKRLALLFLDLDQFKRINDTLGHPGGDQLLRVTAERIAMHVRGEDTIARFGGDEFAVIAEEIESRQDAVVFSDKLDRIIREPLMIGGIPVAPTASIGIGIYPDDGETPECLYQAADAWMYRAKKSKHRSVLCELGSARSSIMNRTAVSRLPVSFGPCCEIADREEDRGTSVE
ncbi:MAG: diguanylate cyclase [Candidatus Thiodiazotropha sp.]